MIKPDAYKNMGKIINAICQSGFLIRCAERARRGREVQGRAVGHAPASHISWFKCQMLCNRGPLRHPPTHPPDKNVSLGPPPPTPSPPTPSPPTPTPPPPTPAASFASASCPRRRRASSTPCTPVSPSWTA